METGCRSLHRLEHRAVITMIIVFSLLFYILCMHIHYYNRTLEVIGMLKNVDEKIQQISLYRLFTGLIDVEDGKYVLMKNGYQFSGQNFLFLDTFSIGLSVGYLIITTILLRIYKIYLNKQMNQVKNELDYLKTEIEHYLFGTKIIRNDNYRECNYLLDRLEQSLHSINLSNKKEFDRMIDFHQNIIHQINTPLNTIKILIEFLYNDSRIDKQFLDDMNYAIQKASDLTRVYLRNSKLETGKVRYNFQKIELCDLIEEVFCSLKIYADYYHAILINKCENSVIYADEVWIKEAIENI